MNEDSFDNVLANSDCLYSGEQIELALDELAANITTELSGSNPLVLCVMNGALIPAGYLLTRLKFSLELDYIHATRYRGNTSGGELHWLAKPSCSLKDRVVLVVDDILDEGITLEQILAYCRKQGAEKVLSCVLVEKIHSRKNDLVPDFVGMTVEDRYVFGFGMDYKDNFRNVYGIYAVKGS